jgi:hypothetical protein
MCVLGQEETREKKKEGKLPFRSERDSKGNIKS